MKENTTQPTENSQIPDPDQVLYEDKTDAERAATARGCSGTHSHEVDGRTHHMPCDSHQQYHGGDSGVEANDEPASGFGGGLLGRGASYDNGDSGRSYVGSRFDITTMMDSPDPTSNEPTSSRGGGMSDMMSDFSRLTTEGDDPFLVGNAGQFNSPYEADEDEEEYKYE